MRFEGKLSDLVAAGWEQKRQEIYRQQLAAEERQANLADWLRLVSMALVLLMVLLSQACAPSGATRHRAPAWKRTALNRDPEPPQPDSTYFRL